MKIEIYYWGHAGEHVPESNPYIKVRRRVAIPFLWDCYLDFISLKNYPGFSEPFSPRVRELIKICTDQRSRSYHLIQEKRIRKFRAPNEE